MRATNRHVVTMLSAVVAASASVAFSVAFSVVFSLPLAAQSAIGAPANPDSATHPPPLSARSLPRPFRGGPLVTGINMWAGGSAAVRTAAHNEKFDGSLSMVGVQFTRSLFTAKGIQFSWIIEVVPIMLATVEAPANRVPTKNRNAEAFFDPVRYKRYTSHDVYGFGFAPFSAEATKPLTDKLTTFFSITSGGAFFSAVVPYGKATQANFTASPALALEWKMSESKALALGYTLHHLSNASIGDANPGMNSHVIFVRVSRARFSGVAR